MYPIEPAAPADFILAVGAAPVQLADDPRRNATAVPALDAQNPLQERVAEDLLRSDQARPTAELSWAPELRAWLDESLRDHVRLVGPQQVW